MTISIQRRCVVNVGAAQCLHHPWEAHPHVDLEDEDDVFLDTINQVRQHVAPAAASTAGMQATAFTTGAAWGHRLHFKES